MANTAIPLPQDTWTLVSAAAVFLVENKSGHAVYCVFKATAPTGTIDAEAAITLEDGDFIQNGGYTGSLYIISPALAGRCMRVE